MRRNNKGFSLVELIVALAIFAIAGVAVFGFTVNSSRLYQRSNTDVKLQYEQQLTVNQIRDMVVESDKGIYFDEASKTLALYGAVKSESGGKVYPVTVIRYKQPEGKMYFGTKEFSAVTEITFADVDTNKLLAEDVTDFKVDLTQVENDKVLFEVSFMVADKVQTVLETVALRNRLVVSNQVDTIWGDDPIAIDSFIKKISILRGSKEFAYDETDEIGKSNPVVVVAYQAKVIANEESNRDYTVSWSLDREITGVGLSVVEGEAVITIASEVPSSTTFYLYATSVDDPKKKTRIQIKVMDFGIYPESMTLELGDVTDGNGFRTYKFIPTLYYTDGTPSSDYNLFTWDGVNALPAGCSFNKDTGVLTLASTANGTSIKVKAISKERKADGTVLFAEYTIDVDGITEFVPGPSVKIVAAKNLSRGGTVYPTMVFEGASHSNYTYTWKVEPYYDETTTDFDSVNVTNSSFNLVSLRESGGYDNYGQHEVTTGMDSRSTTLGCAAYLNWTKTFKVKVTGTATDVSNSETNGTVLEAAPVIVTIEPVKLSIERYGYGNDPYKQEYPILTDSELRYEQWYFRGDDPNTNAAKEQISTRRWFYVKPENIYITASNQQGTTWTGKFVYMDATQTLFEWESWRISDIKQPSMMLSGFEIQMINWEYQTPRPAYMNYALEISDNYGNKILSNTEEFKVVYELYYPDED